MSGIAALASDLYAKAVYWIRAEPTAHPPVGTNGFAEVLLC